LDPEPCPVGSSAQPDSRHDLHSLNPCVKEMAKLTLSEILGRCICGARAGLEAFCLPALVPFG
jgi:hypothetical protein